MNTHDTVRKHLAEAAAGLLEAGELRRVEQHVQECEACRKEMDRWFLLTKGLRQLPQPSVPAGLVERTQARVVQQYAGTGQQRNIGWLLGVLAVGGWIANLVFWISAQALLGVRSPLMWTAGWMLLAWITAVTAAVLLGRQVAVKMRRNHEPLS